MLFHPFHHARVSCRLLALVALVVGVSACGIGSQESSTGGTLDGVGRIPGNDFVGVATLPPDIAADVKFPKLQGAVLGSVATGNRLLIVGDSIVASISKRYGNEACALMVPQGWKVALEAEAGQFAEFGSKVLDRRWNEGWDAVVLVLGTNYDGNKTRYRTAMEKILAKISPTPVLLLNTTEFRSKQAQVNEIIEDLVATNENATLLDWRTISATRSVRANDGIHPSDDGRVVLATAIARAVGVAPASPGDCMKPYFQDDSRVLKNVMPTIPSGTTVTGETVPAPQSSVVGPTTTGVKPAVTSTIVATTVPQAATTVAAATTVVSVAPTTAVPPASVPPMSVPTAVAPPPA
jgi:hypothetical protein